MKENEVTPERPAEKMNWDAIERYLRANIKEIEANEPMKIKQFSAGYSNLTFQVQFGDWEAVLRRPPFGYIPPKAHDMSREYRVLQKIHPVFPYAPKPYLFCDDPEITDRPFYVMEKKRGVVLDDTLPPEYEANERTGRLVSETVVNTLVELHSIDYVKAGLSDLGRPEGYLERQVTGWIKRYHDSKTDDIPGVENIEKWLLDHMPVSPSPTIVHNDFKLNNMMLAADNPGKAVGVFDWELCTIGDPLTDLASTVAYWSEKGEGNTGLTSVTTNPGFITRREFLHLYAEKSGRDLGNIDYYLTFAFYKIAVVLQQLYYRWKIGEHNDERFSGLLDGIYTLMNLSERARRKELL